MQPEQEGSLVSWVLNLLFDRQGRWDKGFLLEARTNMGTVTARNVIVGRITGGEISWFIPFSHPTVSIIGWMLPEVSRHKNLWYRRKQGNLRNKNQTGKWPAHKLWEMKIVRLPKCQFAQLLTCYKEWIAANSSEKESVFMTKQCPLIAVWSHFLMFTELVTILFTVSHQF